MLKQKIPLIINWKQIQIGNDSDIIIANWKAIYFLRNENANSVTRVIEY